MTNTGINLKGFIRDIPDFPRPGILFRDITPLLADRTALGAAIAALAEPFMNEQVDLVAAVEARGFLFGPAVAQTLGAGFVPFRKKGKLPAKTEVVYYDLEYGQDSIEVHHDAVRPGMRVLMLDDLLATGGTMAAACKLMETFRADVVGLSFLIELAALNGREKLKPYRVHSVITY